MVRSWRGDRRITLHEPHRLCAPDPSGHRRRLPPTEHRVWATRRDRTTGDSETLIDHTEIGRWQTIFRVRQPCGGGGGLEDLDTTWWVTDERGVDMDIERVGEPPGTRRRWWDIYAVARIGDDSGPPA